MSDYEILMILSSLLQIYHIFLRLLLTKMSMNQPKSGNLVRRLYEGMTDWTGIELCLDSCLISSHDDSPLQ